ncbi:MAG: HNH endonuclease [Candidatus Nanoarchaeia archaeon]
MKSGEDIVVQNKKNKKLDIVGKVEEVKPFVFLGNPYAIIDGMKIFLDDLESYSIYPKKIKIKEDVQEGPGRKSIPKSLKFAVWERYFGEKLRGRCLCCGVQEISRDDCEMCHIISVANGGDTTIDNLKPGCKTCNRSMGTMDFDEYKRRYHL